MPVDKVKTFVPTLSNRNKNFLHCKILQLYIQLGMKLTNIHRVLEFKQSQCLKPHIDYNTEERKKTSNYFEKGFFKLINYSLYDKAIENLKSRVDVSLSQIPKTKLVRRPSFVSQNIFNEKLSAIQKIKKVLKLNKPAYIGECAY